MTLQLLHGDCLNVMRDISDASVDLILCDLPYGCLTGGGGQEKRKRRFVNGKDIGTGVIAGCSWDIKINLEAFWKEVKRIRRNDHSPCIHFCSTKFGFDLYASNPSEFRYDIVWAKKNAVGFLTANKKPMASHEMIYVFSKKGAYYNRKDIIETTEVLRCVTSVITIPNKKRKGGHPTEKSVELYRWLLERYCPAGGTVLDPTFGSGNSIFTAHEMGLSAIGIEKDEGFYKKAVAKLGNTIEHIDI